MNRRLDGMPEIVKKANGYEEWLTDVDYSRPENWISLPQKPEKPVDVIYFYPTCYDKTKSDDPDICRKDDATVRDNARYCLRVQACVFAESCNIFAPYYRQVSGDFAYVLPDEQNGDLLRYSASRDPADALDHYFEHLNGGRPFIIAGHSQGAETVNYLLADYMREHEEYYRRMIFAFVPGYSVTKSFLLQNPHLRFATGEDDTGVILSWNTEGPDNIGQHNAVVRPGAVSINPLNWKLDGTYAPISENPGSLDVNIEESAGLADARVDTDRGVVICTSDVPKVYRMIETDMFGPCSYHAYDIGFYFKSIRINIQKRIDAFFNSERR